MREAHPLPQAKGDTGTDKDISLIGHVQVSLAAQVGTVTMSVERLFGLKSGDVISMNELLDAPLTLMLNGRAVATAELLAVDDHFGVRILELA
ncbi:FliM/FliN family flagellar motor switch protein [Lysobacter alkalisoli]|uniref:Flagellar motor switch protein FliN n=2 Tax=Marilutibacter alkalisoli TaxID=2591633 RepID=A0A514BWN8_9GAMM|nr:FliM/FliN family flagellar motor switch protein [Lysobacter alkalisoli]